MASTYTLQRVIDFTRRFIRQAPLTFSGTSDPALMIGDWVRNIMLAPPFAWRWNRSVVSPVTCVIGQNNYQVNLPNFGWIEQASLTDTVANTAFELVVGGTFTQEVVNNLPTHIAAWLDDDNGNITFRLQPPPDKAYVLNIVYQNASPKFGTLGDMWTPIPDYFQHIFQQGFLAKSYEYMGDERFAATMQMFARSLVAVNGGLTQTQKNIFLMDMLNTQITQQSSAQESQIANQSRSLI